MKEKVNYNSDSQKPRAWFKGNSFKFSYFRIFLNFTVLMPFLLLAYLCDWYVKFIVWLQGVLPK